MRFPRQHKQPLNLTELSDNKTEEQAYKIHNWRYTNSKIIRFTNMERLTNILQLSCYNLWILRTERYS